MDIDYAFAIKPLLRDISECGDTARVIIHDDLCFMALIDVLGHGSEARTVALKAEAYLDEYYGGDLMDVMKGLHRCLVGSRGAVVSLCSFDKKTGRLRYSGIGNITTRIIGNKSTRLVSRDGIVGYGTIRPYVQEISLLPGDVLLLHSDGIKEHFDVLECAGLFSENAENIANGILERFGAKSDDASCLVLKYLK